jgi:hypothetical protein
LFFVREHMQVTCAQVWSIGNSTEYIGYGQEFMIRKVNIDDERF